MEKIEALIKKVVVLVTSSSFESKAKGNVNLILLHCEPEIKQCLASGYSLISLVRILNSEVNNRFVFRYDSFFKAWKKISAHYEGKNHSPIKNVDTKPVLEKTYSSGTTTNIKGDSHFYITNEDKLGNVFTNDPDAPFGRDKQCYPYHEITSHELDSLTKKGLREIDAKKMLQYGLTFEELFGMSLPLKSQISPKIDSKIESIQKYFSANSIGMAKTKYKDIIK
jgi:hypothetical protein